MILRDGVVLNLHEQEPYAQEALSQHIRRERDFFEITILDYIRASYPDHSIILDIGANIGNHTVYFAKYLRHWLIVAIEPIKANYDILLSNVGPYDNVITAHFAVGDHEGFVSMVENCNNMGNSRVANEGPLSIPVRTVDSFNLHDVTLMKIDVEGYEDHVLRGAKETIERSHPLVLIEDWQESYSEFLPGYELERAWTAERTYLYKWTG